MKIKEPENKVLRKTFQTKRETRHSETIKRSEASLMQQVISFIAENGIGKNQIISISEYIVSESSPYTVGVNNQTLHITVFYWEK